MSVFMAKKTILVIGCGSIGERHLRCLQHTGRAEVFTCDTNTILLQKMQQEYGVVTFNNLNDALSSHNFDGAVICTPANTHISIARTLVQHGAALLIEKPLSIGFEGIAELQNEIEASGKFAGVAYVYHFIPSVQQAREFLRAGTLGKPLQVTVVGGQHFPTFRPAYRDIYYNNHATGGGAIQDALTHLVNAVEWLIGPTTKISCVAGHQMLEGVMVEDTASVAAKNGETIVSYSLNQFQAPNETTIQIHCENGSLKIEVHEQRWAVFRRGAERWEIHPAPVSHRDDLFRAQAAAFLDGIDGKANPLCTVAEALQTLKFNIAALESARAEKVISIV
jgi:predicted dehydrogenase